MLQDTRLSRWTHLFLISTVSLFLEMAVIRWASSEVRLLSYFKNLLLLAAFLGLAIGFGLVGKKKINWKQFTINLVLFIAITLLLSWATSERYLAYPGSHQEFLWFNQEVAFWASWITYLGTILLFFILIMLLFMPLGHATGEEMAKHQPVPAYIVNLLASIAGVWLFALVSYFRTVPAVWFGLALILIGYYIYSLDSLPWITLFSFIVVIAVLSVSNQDTVWSPYQRLEVENLVVTVEDTGEVIQLGHTVSVQQIFFTTSLNLSEEFVARYKDTIPILEDYTFIYDLPYQLTTDKSKVLIVGGGLGDDAAAAIRNGARSIDLVEIDPSIVEFGLTLHPEDPYHHPSVNLIVDDARSFFEKSGKKYNVIAFGFLDSQTLLSSLSNIRLDSFVYTVNSFEEVKLLLEKDGIVSVGFAHTTSWITERIGRMLAQVFDPGSIYIFQSPTGIAFIIGPIPPEQISASKLTPWEPSPEFDDLPIPTDDWPYLYMRRRMIPDTYLMGLLVIGFVAFLFIKRTFAEALNPDWHFWFLGAAFLLMEFRSITEFALLFGTTWMVNVLAISGVLMMALAANLFVLRWNLIGLQTAYILLLASIGFNFFFPIDELIGLSYGVRALFSMVLLSLPLFFAGLIFSISLKQANDTSRPLASNLSGAVAGGALEYTSLIWGVKNLYLVAAVLYLAAYLSHFRKKG
jgi:spermidine synthase